MILAFAYIEVDWFLLFFNIFDAGTVSISSIPVS